jgi:hypothetical protein
MMSKGYDLNRHSWVHNRGTSDVTKGNGTAQGYSRLYYPDGTTSNASWEGKVTTSVVDGKSMTTGAGTWKLIPGTGTGEWKNREGSGTYKFRVVGDGISFVEWEGEWRPKR